MTTDTKEPSQAIDAVLETSEKFKADGLEVHPLTLGRYALLELVESPFVTPGKKFSIAEILPSIYIMTSDMRAISGYDSASISKLKAKSLEWADSREFKELDKLIDCVSKRVSKVEEAAPAGTSGVEGEAGEKKTQPSSQMA